MATEDQIQRKIHAMLAEFAGPKTTKAIQVMLIDAAGYAATMTPIDTSNLINSQFRRVVPREGGQYGYLGYTAAYAAAVHDKKGTTLGKGVARDRNDPSRGNFWDPDAEPEFLKKAFEENIDSIRETLIKAMRL
jgi:hypothetical protein